MQGDNLKSQKLSKLNFETKLMNDILFIDDLLAKCPAHMSLFFTDGYIYSQCLIKQYIWLSDVNLKTVFGG